MRQTVIAIVLLHYVEALQALIRFFMHMDFRKLVLRHLLKVMAAHMVQQFYCGITCLGVLICRNIEYKLTTIKRVILTCLCIFWVS